MWEKNPQYVNERFTEYVGEKYIRYLPFCVCFSVHLEFSGRVDVCVFQVLPAGIMSPWEYGQVLQQHMAATVTMQGAAMGFGLLPGAQRGGEGMGQQQHPW
jgi:hypothetical protein